jgi:hypothetical protein
MGLKDARVVTGGIVCETKRFQARTCYLMGTMLGSA